MAGAQCSCMCSIPRAPGTLAAIVQRHCAARRSSRSGGRSSYSRCSRSSPCQHVNSPRQMPCLWSLVTTSTPAPLSTQWARKPFWGVPASQHRLGTETSSGLGQSRHRLSSWRGVRRDSFLWKEASRGLAATVITGASIATDAAAESSGKGQGSVAAPPPSSQPLRVPQDSASTSGPAEGKPRSSAYPFPEIEAKWQTEWEKRQTFRTPEEVDTSKPKYYVLDMFPYPSGAGLHVGHPEGYTATDIVARYRRMRGFNVLHPMGWDAFGLPAEQYAIDTGTHPRVTTYRNIDRFRSQLKSLGFSYDWQREISTTDPEYYKWTQWIFLQIFNRGLAYQANVPVNWCPALGTVLANEEVVDGLSERGGHPVIRKPMRQWMLRITAYAERLLADLEDLDWPESIKEMQRNWIGKSEGAELEFRIKDVEGSAVRVFTTRPDTICGATYLVLAPEHELVAHITTPEQKAQVEAYVEAASRKSDLERTELAKDKTGVDTGARALNPATGEEIPIWVADYVLGSYGTGAIMAVPAHDSRDWEFAHALGLPVREVVSRGAEGGDGGAAYAGPGRMVNSTWASTGLDLDGRESGDAAEEVITWLEEQGLGKKQVNYKLRDWLFARQRYWGEPFPLLLLTPEGDLEGDAVAVAVPETDLPVTLPDMDDFSPTGTGEPPLAKATDWLDTVDPASGRPARRETNTMPQWAGSCWYYLRFIDPNNDKALVDPEKERYWGPVDLYVGGAEHSVLHLLYARFWHKVLFDIGVVSTKEPFQRLINQGMILGEVEYTVFRDASGAVVSADKAPGQGCTPERIPEDQVLKKGEGYVLKSDPSLRVSARAHKMSKSRGNVVNPDDVVGEFGADSLRLYEMFMGPLRETKIWSTKGVEGVHRFLARVWRLAAGTPNPGGSGGNGGALATAPGLTGGLVRGDVEPSPEQLKAINQCIKKVTEELEGVRFNTAISAMMEFVNQAYKWESVPASVFEPLVLLLSPFAPHVAEELWERLGHSESLAYHPWPQANPEYLKEDMMKLPVQVNGKVKAVLEIEADAGEAAVLEAAMQQPSVKRLLDGKQIKKKIFVPKKILNIIVG